MAASYTPELLQVIKERYGSLDKPDYSFVRKVVAAKPYAALLQQVKALFEVEDITELNDDVSFRYLLPKSRSQLVIELSMVGPYAVILKSGDRSACELVSQDTLVREERALLSLLMAHGLTVMEERDLLQPCALKLFNTEPENVCVYQALFSDTDVIPWKAKP